MNGIDERGTANSNVVTDEPALMRDQRRALHAYRCVEAVAGDQQRNYKIVVNGFGADIMRSGLSAALASLQRKKGTGGDLLLGHLASARIPTLQNANVDSLVSIVNQLPVDSYILTSRECLKVVSWLKRAVQARFEKD